MYELYCLFSVSFLLKFDDYLIQKYLDSWYGTFECASRYINYTNLYAWDSLVSKRPFISSVVVVVFSAYSLVSFVSLDGVVFVCFWVFCLLFSFAGFFFAETSYAKRYSSWGALFDRYLLVMKVLICLLFYPPQTPPYAGLIRMMICIMLFLLSSMFRWASFWISAILCTDGSTQTGPKNLTFSGHPSSSTDNQDGFSNWSKIAFLYWAVWGMLTLE